MHNKGLKQPTILRMVSFHATIALVGRAMNINLLLTILHLNKYFFLHQKLSIFYCFIEKLHF